jgi:DNA-binding NtrC family response regulator
MGVWMQAQPPIRVLLLDGDPAFLSRTAAELQRRGLEVSMDSGPEGRQRIGEGFRVVVMDLHLRGVDGLELLREIRSSCPDTEVIVLTGRPSMGSAVECVREGVFDYLIKPQGPDTLAGRIRQASLCRRPLLAAAGAR